MKLSSLLPASLAVLVLMAAAPLAHAQRGAAYRGAPSYTSASRGVYPSAYRSAEVRVGRVWVPGRYVLAPERVFVPGRSERVWIPAAFELRVDGCGRRSQVCVRGGHWEIVQHPGHYEIRTVRVWQPGHWSYPAHCN